MKKDLKNMTEILKDYFKSDIKIFKNSDGELIERYLTHTTNIEDFVQKILEERNIQHKNATLIFGLDGGQGKFLVTLIVKDDSKDYDTDKYKPTSFHKILIPAEVEDIPENTYNLQVIFDALDVEKLSKIYKVVGDLKIYNIMLGLQSSGAMHSCPYGECYKITDTLKKTNQKGAAWVKGRNRTPRNIRENRNKWAEETHENRKLLMRYFNCEFPPVFQGNDDMTILEILSIPYLHTILLGPFNSL